MTAELISNLSTLTANSPVTLVGGGLACAGAALFVVTRAPEFLLMTASAAIYAVIAAMPLVQS